MFKTITHFTSLLLLNQDLWGRSPNVNNFSGQFETHSFTNSRQVLGTISACYLSPRTDSWKISYIYLPAIFEFRYILIISFSFLKCAMYVIVLSRADHKNHKTYSPCTKQLQRCLFTGYQHILLDRQIKQNSYMKWKLVVRKANFRPI